MRELGSTPLMLALQRGHRRAARVLLDAGADRLAAHDDGCPMLSFAAEGGCADLVAALLARDADVNAASHGRTALSFAAHPRIVRQLLNARAETNPAGCGPVLAGACAARELESVRVLLDAGAAGFHGLGRVLMSPESAENKRSELVRPILTLLLDAGASMQQLFSGLAPLPVVATSADAVAAVSAAEVLLSCDPTTLDSTGEAGRSGLAVAAGRGNAPLVSLLLGAGAAVDARDSSGATALMYALSQPTVVRPSLMTVRAMLQAGADTNARDSAGQTVLFHLYTTYRTHTTPSHTACDHSAAPSRPRRWWRACLHLLLAAGADVCGCDAKGETLLTVAMGHGAEEFVELLLEVVSQCRMGKVNRIN
jgi:ankyrin repeat protein